VFVDILGDDNIEPWRLMQGPNWIKGFRGNEMQRLIRRMKFEGRYLKEMRPDKYHKMMKQIWYLYKKYNQRRIRSNFWGRGAAQKGRILKY
jgi:large subunit ribosomal protein L51